MTRDDIKRLFPNATDDVIRRTVGNQPAGDRPLPSVQKLQDAGAGKADHKPEEPGVDEGSSGHYRIRIALLISDNRERDGDGAEATLLDCLCHARKRLLSLPDSVLLAMAARAKGAGGRENRD